MAWLANGLGAGIALGLQLFGAGLHALALRLKGFETHHVELEAFTAGKAFRYFVELRTYEFESSMVVVPKNLN